MLISDKKRVTHLLVSICFSLIALTVSTHSATAAQDRPQATSRLVSTDLFESAQRCGTAPPTLADQLAVEQALQAQTQSRFNLDACTDVQIPVCWHVIRDGTSGDLMIGDIQNQITILNDAFPNHTFSLDTSARCLTNDDNAEWFGSYVTYFETTVKPALVYSPQTHLNIYSGEVETDSGSPLLGYAAFPWDFAADPNVDGVVIEWSSVDGIGTAPPYNEGDTLVHEVGHWLGLLHIWGDGSCTDDDYVADTALSNASNYGCPVGHSSCGTVDNINNFMDYTDDSCMTQFTAGQIDRMCLMTGVYRPQLLIQSDICGNNIIEAGETCDDGNTKNGDGCSQACRVEGNGEICASYTAPKVDAGTGTISNDDGQVCALFEMPVTLAGSVGTMTDVNLALSGDHAYFDDLQAFLTSPSGTSVLLAENECGDENGSPSGIFDVQFDDAASAGACAWTASADQPSGSLANFNGEHMVGTWTLTICDSFSRDSGRLTTASLDICAYREATAVDLNTMSSQEESSITIFGQLLLGVIILFSTLSAVVISYSARDFK